MSRTNRNRRKKRNRRRQWPAPAIWWKLSTVPLGVQDFIATTQEQEN